MDRAWIAGDGSKHKVPNLLQQPNQSIFAAMTITAPSVPTAISGPRPTGWVVYAFAVSAALPIVAKVADQLGLEGLIVNAADVWRDLTHILWSDFFLWLAKWVRVSATPSELDGLTLATLIAATAASCFLRSVVPSPVNRVPWDGWVTQREALLFSACLSILYWIFVSPRMLSFLDGNELAMVVGKTTFIVLFVLVLFVSSRMICLARPLLTARGKSPWFHVANAAVVVYFGGMLWASANIGFGDTPLASLVAAFFAASVFALTIVKPQALTSMCVVAAVALSANWLVEVVEPAVTYFSGAVARAQS